MPKTEKKEIVAITLRLPVELAEQLDAYVEDQGVMRHPLIVDIIDGYLNGEDYPRAVVQAISKAAGEAAKAAVIEAMK